MAFSRFPTSFAVIAFSMIVAACNSSGGGGPTASGQPQAVASPEKIKYIPSPLAISFDKDTTDAVSQTITSDGGKLTATGSDGTVYTLNIPAGALITDESITITPIENLQGLPLDGNIAKGAQLSPEGLQLLKPATLTIEVPAGLAPTSGDRLVGFGYHGDGGELYLKSVTESGGTTATLNVQHFSGYGVSDGTDQQIKIQQDEHAPTDPSDWADQENAGSPSLQGQADTLQTFYALAQGNVLAAQNAPDLMDQAFDQYQQWVIMYDASPAELQGYFSGENAALETQVITAFQNALVDAQLKCQQHDLTQIARMLRWSFLIMTHPLISKDYPDAQSVVDKATACGRFRLEFDSTIHQDNADGTILMELGAKVPIMADYQSTPYGLHLSGSDTDQYLKVTWPQSTDCIIAASGNGDTFTVPNLDLGLNLSNAATQPGAPIPGPLTDVHVAIDPGRPTEHLEMSCTQGSFSLDYNYWLGAWTTFHHDLMDIAEGGYVLRDWNSGMSGDATLATWTSDNADSSGVTEHTEVKLVHTPAPL